MTVAFAKLIFSLSVLAWALIRAPHQSRAWRTPVRTSVRDVQEWFLLAIAATGLAVLPGIFVASRILRDADYPFVPALAWIGTAVFLVSLWIFYLAHRDLGRNYSSNLEIRPGHSLVTSGIYRHVRHPMYSGFWLWAVAQALLLSNWVAGPAGLVGFGILFFFRIGHEERLMLDEFGQDYRRYMDRTGRIVPWL